MPVVIVAAGVVEGGVKVDDAVGRGEVLWDAHETAPDTAPGVCRRRRQIVHEARQQAVTGQVVGLQTARHPNGGRRHAHPTRVTLPLYKPA